MINHIIAMLALVFAFRVGMEWGLTDGDRKDRKALKDREAKMPKATKRN